MNEEKFKEARQKLCLYLKTEADRKGITHQQIADITGFQKPNVTRMLNAYYAPSLDNFLTLADAIGVKIELE